ncbi:MAG: DUF3795 domain-containing protein [Anaerolineae bacterium]|nr:DUF3795 domain-containing protein [Anaerolineae bacterium]
MNDRMVAYCGLACAECEAYLATQADDVAKLAELAQQWYQSDDVTVIRCAGCATEGLKSKWCGECPTRLCAIERGVPTCAHCADYGCAIITQHIEMAPQIEPLLASIRTMLGR